MLIIAGLGAGAQFSSHVIPDTAWSLYVAERLLAGSRLYVDIIEVNPPLIIWLTLVPAWLSGLLGVSDVFLYRVGVIVLCLGSVGLCARVLRLAVPREDVALRRLVLLLVLFAALPAAREDFGEREHLLLALTCPYVLLAAARARRAPVPGGLGIMVGLLAGLGIALKPYFVTLWLALESWLFFAAKIRGIRKRIEGLVIVLVGVGYLGTVLLMTPEYPAIVGALGSTYFRYLTNGVALTVITGDGTAIGLFALLAYLALRPTSRRRELWTALAVATAGFYVSALIQHKGWRYHFYPSLASGLVLIGVMAWDQAELPGSFVRRIYSVATSTAALLAPAFIAVACLVQMLDPSNKRYESDPDLERLLPVVSARAAGKSVLVLSYNMASSFPLVTYSEAQWASRFPSVWMLLASYQSELFREGPLRYRPPQERVGVERFMADAVIADFEKAKPELLLVLRSGPDRPEFAARRLDYLRYFRMDPRFERLFQQYGYLQDVGQYQIYQRGADRPTPNPSPDADWPGRRRPIVVGVEVRPLGVDALARALAFAVIFALFYSRRAGTTWL